MKIRRAKAGYEEKEYPDGVKAPKIDEEEIEEEIEEEV